MANKSSIKIRNKKQDNGMQIRILIAHPMHNGRFRDPEGKLIPAHFIQELEVKLNDNRIISTQLSGSISKDPFFVFWLKSANPGDKITVSWSDNLQFNDSKDYILR